MCSDSPLCAAKITAVAEVEAGAENEVSKEDFCKSYHVSHPPLPFLLR